MIYLMFVVGTSIGVGLTSIILTLILWKRLQVADKEINYLKDDFNRSNISNLETRAKLETLCLNPNDFLKSQRKLIVQSILNRERKINRTLF